MLVFPLQGEVQIINGYFEDFTALQLHPCFRKQFASTDKDARPRLFYTGASSLVSFSLFLASPPDFIDHGHDKSNARHQSQAKEDAELGPVQLW